jgi:CheY-like chemotaxis protein
MRLLMVDDDDLFRRMMGDVLATVGDYNVSTSNSGQDAIEKLQKEQFDVILLDYKMPGLSGLNVLQWMHEQKLETPVLMMTAAGSETVAVEAMKLGAYDYLRKEYIEIDHLPIIINGIYERYLFKKEKERQQFIEHERDKIKASVEASHETVSGIALIVKNALAVISLNFVEYERNLEAYISHDGRRQLSKVFADLKQDYSVVASSLKWMINIHDSIYQKLHGVQELPFGIEPSQTSSGNQIRTEELKKTNK